MKVILASIVFILLFYSVTYSADKVIQPGEEIIYDVSFLGISLGKVTIITEENQTLDNKSLPKTKAIIESNKGIPYYSLYTVYQSWLDPTISYSHKFVGNSKFSSDPWVYQEIDFNYDGNFILNRHWIEKVQVKNDTINIDGKWNDGLSLFFLARKYLNLNKSIKIPSFIGDEKAKTVVNFTGKKEDVEIDAVDYPIKSVFLNGKAEWEGVYGLSGEFKGWFSDDEARVPIKAYMQVIVGSVKIELVKWKRKGWNPPKS